METTTPEPKSPAALTVVHIFSASYSGSTWLNLVLGSHPQAFSVGEVKTILKLGRPICTIHGNQCQVWPRFNPGSSENFYHQLHRLTGKRIFVINNSRKWLAQQDDPAIRSFFIHLVRDGRAVVASRVRKGVDRSLWASCHVWKREVRRNRYLIRKIDPSGHVELQYEKLVADPDTHFPPLCQSIGIAYDSSMLEFWRHDHHFLGGNRGTLHSMMRMQDKKLADDPEKGVREKDLNWDLGYYEKADTKSFRDERWKQELTPRQQRLFALFAGMLNRRLGY